MNELLLVLIFAGILVWYLREDGFFDRHFFDKDDE